MLCSAADERAADASPACAPRLQRRVVASAPGAALAMDARASESIEEEKGPHIVDPESLVLEY